MENQNEALELTGEEMERLLALSECAMAIAYQGTDMELQYANEQFYKLLQYTPQEFRDQFNNRLMEVIIPEEKQKIRALIARQSVAGGETRMEFRVRRKDGAICWMSLTARIVYTEGRNMYYCSLQNITQQKRNLQDVYNAKKELDLITNSVPGGVIKIKMNDFTLLYANEGFFRLAGYSRVEYFSLFGNHCDKVVHPDDSELVRNMVRTALDNRGAIGFEYRIITKSGEIRWTYANGCRVDDQNGEVVYLCILMDITARKRLEEKYQDNLRRSQYLLQYMKETEWTYVIAEEKLYRSGYLVDTSASQLQSEEAGEESLTVNVHPDDVQKLLTDFQERMERPGQSRIIIRTKGKNGNYSPTEVGMISVDIAGDGKPDRVYGETRALSDDSYILFQDESVKKETAAAMTMARAADRALQLAKEAQAKHEDNITHTMPHNDFFAKVGEILAQRQDDAKFALLCCDVNGFQRIMYHYGISCSSEFLQLLASRFEEISYQNICSRVNGDYFVIFICYESHSELLKMMSRLMLSIEKIEEEVNFATQGTTSGIYLIDQKDTEVSIIMQKADLARRSIKGTIGNHYAIYTEELQENQFLEEGIIRDIGISMRNQSVEICYLPRVRGDKEHVMGCKAVPRIQMKNGTYLPLEDLRRYIDRSSDVQQLVFYVLKNVCVNQGLWKSRGKKIMPVSLDITAGQLCLNNAVERIDEIVKSNNMKPDEILFEIQEQYFLNFSDKFRMALEDLHNRGYRIIISRFGAHHTAVESVRRLPIHAIKFHGELFHKSIINDKDIIVFQKLVEMARDLGMEVSCGSISTQLQDEVARKIGCDIFEGDIYYGAVLGDVYEKCFLND